MVFTILSSQGIYSSHFHILEISMRIGTLTRQDGCSLEYDIYSRFCYMSKGIDAFIISDKRRLFHSLYTFNTRTSKWHLPRIPIHIQYTRVHLSGTYTHSTHVHLSGTYTSNTRISKWHLHTQHTYI